MMAMQASSTCTPAGSRHAGAARFTAAAAASAGARTCAGATSPREDAERGVAAADSLGALAVADDGDAEDIDDTDG